MSNEAGSAVDLPQASNLSSRKASTVEPSSMLKASEADAGAVRAEAQQLPVKAKKKRRGIEADRRHVAKPREKKS